MHPKGYYTEEYINSLKKFKSLGQYPLMIYGYGAFLVVYSVLILLSIDTSSLDFIAMFCHASYGSFILILFIKTPKIREVIVQHFKSKGSSIDLLKEDVDNFTSEFSPSER